MMYLHAKFRVAKQLAASDPYPASTLLTLLVGTETINLVGGAELFEPLSKAQQLAPVVVELRWKKLDLSNFGGSGRGKAYRLRAVRLIDPKEVGLA